ncbi:MAG: hypothetical protein M3077_05485, partial [Candidatus Dormibacteraeota bacterium]|nr:hypothetical protein [Candidatus Dormibacteraeota bacterium]
MTLAVALALLVPLLPQPGRADSGHSHLTVRATLGAITVNPNLTLSLAVDKAGAIPGDTLGYSGTVTQTGITACIAGSFTAQNTGAATATVADFFDEIDYFDPSTLQWVPLVGYANTRSAFIPVVTPRVSTGVTLTVTGAPANGVSYPASGDPVVGTTIAPNATAAWSGTACLTLTAAQLKALASSPKLREQNHMEDTPGDTGEAWTDNESCPNPFQSGFLNARNIVVTVTPPTGPVVQITSSTVPAFASLAPGASANYSIGYRVPIVATRATGETESAYLQRLANLEGSSLVASASVTATGPTGAVSAIAPPVSTVEHLPVVTIAKTGPTTVTAGTNATYSLALTNSGGAPASSMAVTDTVPSGASGVVSNIPASLAGSSASATAQATFPVSLTQSAGDLTDTATLTWHDANGNSYGSVSSSFTTQVQAPYKLTLPATAGPNPTGAPQAISATLVDLGSGQPVANKVVTLTITGPNAQVMTATSDMNGIAVFAYIGVRAGTDLLQATASTAQSNTLSIVWYTPIQKVTTTPVQGNFYAEPTNPQSLAVTPQSVPDFSQTFPNIAFNPPSGTIPHSPVGLPTDQTRPFTDVTTDLNGNYSGTIVAQGNSLQAGLGNMTNFNAVFTANLVVAQAGDVTFNFFVDDGFLFGVGNGASRVSGAYENAPATNQSAIQGYTLMGAFNQVGAGNRQVTVHFPAAGTYPYELDYFEANGGGLSLSMSVSSFTAQTNPLSVYVGYADGLRAAGSIFPFPWLGSPGVNFIGCCPAFDAGALRFDNSSSSAITLDSVTVDIGGNHFDLWGRNLTVPANQILMLSQTTQYNFDTSDFSGAGCGGNNGVIPKVNVTIAGVTTSYNDSNQILNTFGFDLACRGNESLSWQRIGGGGNTINVPLPPATSLSLSPSKTAVKTVGQTQTFTVSAMDATGHPVANLPVAIAITGANQAGPTAARQLTGTTDSAGLATVSYVGLNAGTDTASATAFVMGLRALSNDATVTWALATISTGGTAPAPAITAPSPVDGATVTKPVPIRASFAPPSGQTIASWNVTYQDLDPLAPVTIASGTGTPPATLGTFDPTLLPNDTYAIAISATASGG